MYLTPSPAGPSLIPEYILTSQDLELGATNAAFDLPGLSYLIRTLSSSIHLPLHFMISISILLN